VVWTGLISFSIGAGGGLLDTVMYFPVP
jgi:hypothetical protein